MAALREGDVPYERGTPVALRQLQLGFWLFININGYHDPGEFISAKSLINCFWRNKNCHTIESYEE